MMGFHRVAFAPPVDETASGINYWQAPANSVRSGVYLDGSPSKHKIMNQKSQSIWKKSWSGPQAFLFWWLMVSAAGLFLAAAMVTVAYFAAPQDMFVWSANLPVYVLQRPKLWAALVGVELMGSFMAAAATAFALYRVADRLLSRRITGAPALACDPAKPSGNS